MMGDEESDAAGEFMLVYDGFDPSLGKATGSSSGLLNAYTTPGGTPTSVPAAMRWASPSCRYGGREHPGASMAAGKASRRRLSSRTHL
jgi:hypothetical protein